MKHTSTVLIIAITLVMASGCASTAPKACIPAHIEKVYNTAWTPTDNDIFVDYYGVAIIDNKAYFITSKDALENLHDNETQQIAIGAGSGPQYLYIYEVCK